MRHESYTDPEFFFCFDLRNWGCDHREKRISISVGSCYECTYSLICTLHNIGFFFHFFSDRIRQQSKYLTVIYIAFGFKTTGWIATNHYSRSTYCKLLLLFYTLIPNHNNCSTKTQDDLLIICLLILQYHQSI